MPGLGIADASWDEGLAAAETATRAAGPVADAFRQRYPGKDRQPCWHLFTLYQTGLQLSLVVMPASWRAGLPRNRWRCTTRMASWACHGRRTPPRPTAKRRGN